MAATKVNATVSSSGTNCRKGLEESRQRAIDYATRHQFYQSDRVKQFHRALLLSETLNDRRLQKELNEKINSTNNEDTRKFMGEIRRGEVEALEQERQRVKKREMDQKECVDYLRRQMQEMEEARQQQKLAKGREMQECLQLKQQYEGDMQALRQQQHAAKMSARNDYLRGVAEKRGERAKESRAEAEAEAARQRYVGEKDRWLRTVDEMMAERLRRREERSRAVGARLAAQERERTDERDAVGAAAMAKALATKEARFQREQSRRGRAHADMVSAAADQREQRRREGQRRAAELRRQARATLGGNQEADREHWERERLAAQRQRDARSLIDAALQEQMAEKRRRERARRRAESDLHRMNRELLDQEDGQFQRYAAGVIGAAEASGRDAESMRRAAGRGRGVGVGPISGGMRANYLVPGATSEQMPEYVGSTAQDIGKLYSTSRNESSRARLAFIW